MYGEAAGFIAPGLWLGLFCGALIGGIGGRLAMFILRLTSDDSLRGLKTDDEFTIGQFSGDTAFLVISTAVLGALGGLIYLGVREWLPPRWRAVSFALLGATVGGALVIRPDGVDFTVLEPLALAVTMFVALPAAYGLLVGLLTERFMSSAWSRQGRLDLGWGPASRFRGANRPDRRIALMLLFGVVVAANRSGRVTTLWRSAPATWLGRGLLASAIGGSAVMLARDVADVL